MTFADDVASHLTTNFAAATKSTGMIFDNIIDKTTAQWQQAGALDVVMVIEQPHTLTPSGWGHVDQVEACTLKVWARVKGSSADLKSRLDVIMDELEHTLHWKNHAISGYTFHAATGRFDGTDKDEATSAAHPQAYGTLTFIAYKTGRLA